MMRADAGWHGKAPNDMEYEVAMAELENADRKLLREEAG